MVKLVYNFFLKVEYDTETNKSRVLSQYTTPDGHGIQKKRKVVSEDLRTEEVQERFI